MDKREGDRRRLLLWRAELDRAAVAEASARICQLALQIPALVEATRVGSYVAVRNEIDPHAISEAIASRGGRIYLPVVRAQRELEFARWRPGDVLQLGPFGLHEPTDLSRRIDPRRLDAVLVPLVGFNRRGHRLGHGAGYYDVTFAFRQASRARRPLLIGLAFAGQQVESIAPQPWDVTLDITITEAGRTDHHADAPSGASARPQ